MKLHSEGGDAITSIDFKTWSTCFFILFRRVEIDIALIMIKLNIQFLGQKNVQLYAKIKN